MECEIRGDAISWTCWFFSFSKKSTVSPLKFNLVEDVNLWGRATLNTVKMNSNDSTVCLLDIYL